jgi:hypothetical protein
MSLDDLARLIFGFDPELVAMIDARGAVLGCTLLGLFYMWCLMFCIR